MVGGGPTPTRIVLNNLARQNQEEIPEEQMFQNSFQNPKGKHPEREKYLHFGKIFSQKISKKKLKGLMGL